MPQNNALINRPVIPSSIHKEQSHEQAIRGRNYYYHDTTGLWINPSVFRFNADYRVLSPYLHNLARLLKANDFETFSKRVREIIKDLPPNWSYSFNSNPEYLLSLFGLDTLSYLSISYSLNTYLFRLLHQNRNRFNISDEELYSIVANNVILLNNIEKSEDIIRPIALNRLAAAQVQAITNSYAIYTALAMLELSHGPEVAFYGLLLVNQYLALKGLKEISDLAKADPRDFRAHHPLGPNVDYFVNLNLPNLPDLSDIRPLLRLENLQKFAKIVSEASKAVSPQDLSFMENILFTLKPSEIFSGEDPVQFFEKFKPVFTRRPRNLYPRGLFRADLPSQSQPDQVAVSHPPTENTLASSMLSTNSINYNNQQNQLNLTTPYFNRTSVSIQPKPFTQPESASLTTGLTGDFSQSTHPFITKLPLTRPLV